MSFFTGYVIRDEKDSTKRKEDSDFESDSDDDDGVFESADQDFDFLHRPSRKLRNSVENMTEMEIKNGRLVAKPGTTRVRGRFDRLFSQPWWMVEIKINKSKSSKKEKLASSLPSYSLRTDDDVDGNLLSLFLTEGCDVHPQHVRMLLEFISTNNLSPTLKDLMENLKTFADSSEDNHTVAEQIQTSLRCSPTGKAFTFSSFTRFAHQLFPRHVCSFFDECSHEELECLSEAFQEESWVFGYWSVLKNRFDLKGCEVKLQSFIDCNLLQAMPVVMQDALRVYDALSQMIYKNGHTYVHLMQLKGQPKVTNVTKWTESLAYLEKINVVKTSAVGDSYHVFLTHIRGFEKTIVRNLTEIMENEPWVGDIEIDEQVFGGDEDQVKAAKLITEKPVVVMSGRGGCGKTFVVSKVLSKTLEVKKRRVMEDHKASLDGADIITPDAGNDVASSPDLNAQSAEDSDRGSDTDGCKVKLDLKCDPGTSNTDLVPLVNEESSSKSKAQAHKLRTKLKEIDNEVLLTAPTGKAASILGKRTKLPSHTLHSVIYSFQHWKDKGEGDWKFSKVRLLVCDECSLIPVRVFSKLVSILNASAQLQQVVLLGDVLQLPSIEPGNFLADIYQALTKHGVSITLNTNHRADSELIVQNAIKISNQQLPIFDESRGFCSAEYQPKRNDADDEVNKITRVVKNVLKRDENSLVLPDPDASQFIAFRRNDCNIINELCAWHYNGHSIKDERGKPNFQIRDKVCVRRNAECLDEYEDVVVKLVNGEIFFIKDIVEWIDNRNRKVTKFSLDNGEKIMKIDFRCLKAAKLSHAWARTIHTFQGSESDTIVYVVGSPAYQNWQHVYTAVTRGVRQVMIINNPSSLFKAIRTPPVTRQTKLQGDMVQAMKYRCWLEENDQAPNTNTHSVTQFGDVHKDELTLQPFDVKNTTSAYSASEVNDKDQEPASGASSSEYSHHLDAEAGANVFFISRENLRIKKFKQDLSEQGYQIASSRNVASCNGLGVQPSQENQMPLNVSEASVLPSPDRKRKHPESTVLLSPPQTPPHFKQLASAFSSVSPLNQASRDTQQDPSAHRAAETTGARRPLTTAKFESNCKVCKERIRPGSDEITPLHVGYNKYWIHGRCATNDKL